MYHHHHVETHCHPCVATMPHHHTTAEWWSRPLAVTSARSVFLVLVKFFSFAGIQWALVPVFLGILFFFFHLLDKRSPLFYGEFLFLFSFFICSRAIAPRFGGGLSLSFCLSFARRALTPVLGGNFFFFLFCFLFHLLDERSPPTLWEIFVFVFVFHLKLLNERSPDF